MTQAPPKHFIPSNAHMEQQQKEQARVEQIRRTEANLLHRRGILQECIDEAADKGDLDAIKQMQLELMAINLTIESCARRIENANVQVTEADKAAQRSANQAAAAAITARMEDAFKLADVLDRTFATLEAQLREMHEHGEAISQSIRFLTRQMPVRQRSTVSSFADAAAFSTGGGLGYAVENTLARAGLFSTVAVHHSLSLTRHDKDKNFSQFFKANKIRSNLGAYVDQLIERVDANI